MTATANNPRVGIVRRFGAESRLYGQFLRLFLILDVVSDWTFSFTVETVNRHLKEMGEDCHPRTIRRDCEFLAAVGIFSHVSPFSYPRQFRLSETQAQRTERIALLVRLAKPRREFLSTSVPPQPQENCP